MADGADRRVEEGELDFDFRPLVLPDAELETLMGEAEEEGFGFIRRLQDDWDSGTNRFDALGEDLLGAWRGGRFVAVGGLNVDPFADDPRVARLRHLFVRVDERRQGVGRRIVNRLLAAAAGRFDVVRLRTDSEAAARLYEKIGFVRTDESPTTHVFHLPVTERIAAVSKPSRNGERGS